jgi:outer membrane protein assembly factor BamB
MKSRVGYAALVVLLAGAFGAGCAVPVAPASSAYRGGDPKLVAAALDRAGPAPAGPVNASGKPMAFVALVRPGSSSTELLAFDLEGEVQVWAQPVDLEGRVAVARAAVVHGTRAGALVAHDVNTGAVKWQRKLGGGEVRVGYAAGGDLVAEVVQSSKGQPRTATVIAYDAASGAKRFSREVDAPVGAPAVFRGLVAVPRQSQWVTLLDGRNGDVLAEILSRKQAASFVRALPEGLFFGSTGVYMASPATALADKTGTGYLEAKVPAFVRPLYSPDLYRRADNSYSAVDRNRLLWRARPSGEAVAFTDDAVVVHNFRFFFGLDAKSGDLRWAYNQPRTDAISSDHTGPAIVFATSEGHIKALDAQSGQPIYEAALPGAGTLSVIGATFDADGYKPKELIRGAQPLPQVLSSMIFDPDRRFADVRMFALEQLTSLSGPDVTRELLKALDVGDVIPPPVLKRAMDILVARQDRALLPVYIDALKVHPDYAEGHQPKRLEFYARAVAALKAKEAVPLLVEYLRLPDTDVDAVTEIADAVLALEAKQSIEPFGDFLLQYRADPTFSGQPGPLVAASNVLLKLGGSKERSLLHFVAEEPQTLGPLAEHLKRALTPEAEGVIKQSE